ncbi:MAG: cyclic peptide export ABC transporter [Deltaproteobacteria bacterium]
MKLKYFRFIRKEAGKMSLKISAFASMAGLLQGMVMVIINGAAEKFPEKGLNFRYLLMFVVCISGFILAKRYSLTMTASLIQHIVFSIRLRFLDKIRNTGLMAFEDIGKSQIYTVLAENTETIFDASRLIANAGSSAVMLIFSFLYIGHLSITAFFLAVIIITGGVSIYLINQKATGEDLTECLKKENEFFDGVNHLLDGFKEIKMNTAKSRDLYEGRIQQISTEARDINIRTEYRFIDNYIFAQAFFYILLATIIFLLPQITDLGYGIITNITAVVLFMVGPLGNIVEALPLVARADVAITNIETLEKSLDAADEGHTKGPVDFSRPQTGFDAIFMENIAFSYMDPDRHKVFTLGPIDLSIKAGEVLFIVGGNGSGKSTLLKILAGLYYPHNGRMLLDNKVLEPIHYARYRNLFSIIFTDFHLFDRLYGLGKIEAQKVFELLDIMELSDKTSFVDDKFTNTKLSTGQRKRLALIASYLEDKPILMFDEVAADQDPKFRKYFYEVLLQDLKQRGKTVIAVTHDDRFFHAADRILKMEDGQIVNG